MSSSILPQFGSEAILNYTARLQLFKNVVTQPRAKTTGSQDVTKQQILTMENKMDRETLTQALLSSNHRKPNLRHFYAYKKDGVFQSGLKVDYVCLTNTVMAPREEAISRITLASKLKPSGE